MDLTTEAENRGAHGGRRLRMDPLYAVGVICLLVLSIQAAAIQFTREPKSQDALHGRSAMLRCEVSEPTDITYRWLHNGQPLENSDRRYQEGSNLKFNAVDRQLDAGNFKCVAQNTAMGEVLHSTNASFNIKWLQPPLRHFVLAGHWVSMARSASIRGFGAIPHHCQDVCWSCRRRFA